MARLHAFLLALFLLFASASHANRYAFCWQVFGLGIYESDVLCGWCAIAGMGLTTISGLAAAGAGGYLISVQDHCLPYDGYEPASEDTKAYCARFGSNSLANRVYERAGLTLEIGGLVAAAVPIVYFLHIFFKTQKRIESPYPGFYDETAGQEVIMEHRTTDPDAAWRKMQVDAGFTEE